MEIVGAVGAVEVGRGGHIPARHQIQFIEILQWQQLRKLLCQEFCMYLIGTEEYRPLRLTNQLGHQSSESGQLPVDLLAGSYGDA